MKRLSTYTLYDDIGLGVEIGKSAEHTKYKYYFSLQILFTTFILRFCKN